jgi:ComF family protein
VIRSLFAAGADLLWPRRCAGCDRRPLATATPFCPDCQLTLMAVDPASSCRRCAAPLAPGRDGGLSRCVDCRRLPALLRRIRAPYEYGGALADALLRLKWQGRDDLALPLGRLLAPALADLAGRCDLLVPVPLHPQRLRQRGYNQASLLAAAARSAAGLRLPLRPLTLCRKRSDPPAKALTVSQRFVRTRDAFAVVQPSAVMGQRVLLLDDVVTTGATALACAKALMAAGALRVEVLALLRASG